MKSRNSRCAPIITLRWSEYKKRSAIDRFPLSILCGLIILTVSLSALYDRALEKKATDLPVSVGIWVIEEELTQDT